MDRRYEGLSFDFFRKTVILNKRCVLHIIKKVSIATCWPLPIENVYTKKPRQGKTFQKLIFYAFSCDDTQSKFGLHKEKKEALTPLDIDRMWIQDRHH